MNIILDQIITWATNATISAINELTDATAHMLLLSPDATLLPQVQALTGRATWIVDTCYVLAFTAAGLLTMVSGSAERPRFAAKDIGPRLVVGFIASHFATMLCSQAVTLTNAFTRALTGDDLTIGDALDAIKTHLKQAASNPPAALLVLVIIVIAGVLLGTTTFSLFTRFATLLIFTAIAPLALACHATPYTEPLAKLWWRCYGGVLVIPMLQGLTLQAGQWMLLDENKMLPLLGLPPDQRVTANLLIVIVLLWTTVRIPRMVGRYVSQSRGGPNFIGQIVRVVIVQQGMRLVGLRGGGRGR